MADGARGPGLATVIMVSVITSAVVSFGILFASAQGWIVLAPPAPADEEVPDLRGLTPDAARGVLEARGLRLVQRDERHDADIAAGRIARQQPGPPSQIPRGSEVTVTLSLGPEQVAVPDMIGLPLRRAFDLINEAGLRVSENGTREGGEGEPGTVSRSIPPAGQRVPIGSEVSLVVVGQQMIAVPNFVGTTSRTAREQITAAGLTLGRTRTRYDEDRNPYVVLSQTPAAGTQVAPGTAIELVINEE